MSSGRPGSIVTAATLALALAPLGAAEEAERFLERYAETFRFSLGQPRAIEVTADGSAILFLRSGPRSFVHDLYEADAATGTERVVLGAESLLGGLTETVSEDERARRERQRLVAAGIASYELSHDGRRILVPLGDRLFVHERASGRTREVESAAGGVLDPRLSPDGDLVAYVRAGDLHVVELAGGRERRLTRGAGATVTHALAEFVAQEEMGRHHGYWWAPDSRSIVYQRTDTAGVETFHLGEAARPELPARPWPYPRAGRANAEVRLGIVPVTGGATTWIEWDRERYEYLAAVTWEPGAPLTIVLQNRRQTEEALLTVDPRDGSTRPLHVERDAAWLELWPRMPRWLPGGREFLWATERSGTWQLELRDRTGDLVRTLTTAELGLQGLELVLAGARELVVAASADPTESQLFRVALDPPGGAPARLSRERGVHTVVSRGEASRFVVQSTTPSGTTAFEIASAAGLSGVRLRSVAEDPGLVPALEFTTVGEGAGFHAVIVRPRGFEPDRRYPVIESVYGGPGAQTVRAAARAYLLDQWLADRGFVVVSVDTRGTPGRGREWSRATRGDLIGLPLEEHAEALRALGRRYPELDLDRVGVVGWSFGGYFAAMAVLRRPDLYRAGVAGAPVTSWEDYDTHYTERYMGLPRENPAGYAAASVLGHAERLSRPLLVIHGTADDNVYFLHSLKLADALFRAGKPFEFLPLSGFTHMVPDPLVRRRLEERIAKFFEAHLGAAPDPR